MRVLPPALGQKLDEGVTCIALAWRITRADGVRVAVTQHDRDIVFGGTTFVSTGSFIGADHEKDLGLSPDRTALSGALRVGAISEADLALGRWDQAKVEAFWVDWSNPVDFIPMWQGLVAGVSWRGSNFDLDIVGPQSVLNREIGRVYARTCDAVLGDARCKVDLAAPGRALSAAITAKVADRCVAIALPATLIAGDFVGGAFAVVSGAAGLWQCDVTNIEVTPTTWLISTSRPFPIAPAIGDMIKITLSCDKAFSTCKARFANALNFRGQPTLPGDDIAFGGPAATGNDGGKR
jgi:uncharacterized phage protein (TIGR02218 family)